MSTFGLVELHNQDQFTLVTYFNWNTGLAFLALIILTSTLVAYRMHKIGRADDFGVAAMFATMVVLPAFFFLFSRMRSGFLYCFFNVLSYDI